MRIYSSPGISKLLIFWLYRCEWHYKYDRNRYYVWWCLLCFFLQPISPQLITTLNKVVFVLQGYFYTFTSYMLIHKMQNSFVCLKNLHKSISLYIPFFFQLNISTFVESYPCWFSQSLFMHFNCCVLCMTKPWPTLRKAFYQVELGWKWGDTIREVLIERLEIKFLWYWFLLCTWCFFSEFYFSGGNFFM